MTDSPAGKIEQPQPQPQPTEQKQPDVPQIPKPRLDEEIGKRRELEIRAAELESKLKQMESTKQEPTDIQKRVAELERRYEAARVANQNGWSEEGANLVMDYQAKGLDAVEALAAAKAKKPDLFGQRGSDSYRAPMHGVLPPQSAVGAPTTEKWDYQEQIKNARSNGRTAKDVTIEDIRRRMVEKGAFRPQ